MYDQSTYYFSFEYFFHRKLFGPFPQKVAVVNLVKSLQIPYFVQASVDESQSFPVFALSSSVM